MSYINYCFIYIVNYSNKLINSLKQNFISILYLCGNGNIVILITSKIWMFSAPMI